MSLPIALCPIFSLLRKCSLQDKWMWPGCQNFLWLSQSTTCECYSSATLPSLLSTLGWKEINSDGQDPIEEKMSWQNLARNMFMIQYSTIAFCPWTAFHGKTQNWDAVIPINRWGKWYLKRLSFLVIVKQSPKQSQGEYLQGCRLGAVPIKLDDVHSSLTALGENGSISTSLWVTFLLCRIYICKCLKSSHLPGVLWLCYNCQSWEKAVFRLASPPAGSSPKTMSFQS